MYKSNNEIGSDESPKKLIDNFNKSKSRTKQLSIDVNGSKERHFEDDAKWSFKFENKMKQKESKKAKNSKRHSI